MKSIALPLFLFAATAASTASALPTTMTYAGVLTDDGVRVEGTVDVTLRLFDDDTAGTQRYSEDLPGLVVVDGELVAELGNNALDDSILELPELWLEVTVDGTALAPRVRLNSVPYALRAEAALRAEEALTLGGLLPSDLVTAQQLATLGLQNGLVAGTGITVNAGTVAIATGGVTAAQLAPNAVTSAALADGAVTTAKLADGGVTSAKLGAAAVVANAIANLAVTLAKLASDSVDGTKVVDGSLGLADHGSNSVDGTKIVDASVAVADLALSSVNSSKIVDASIAAADIGPDVITAGNIAANAVTTSELADNSVTAAKLSGEITIFQVTATGCAESVNQIMSTASCQKSTSGCGLNECRGCTDNICAGGAGCFLPNNFCANARIGTLLP